MTPNQISSERQKKSIYELRAYAKGLNQLAREIPKNGSIPLFIGEQDAAINFLQFDVVTRQRTLRKTEVVFPSVFLVGDLEHFPGCEVPDSAYFVYLPWSDVDAKTPLGILKKYYSVGGAKIINVRGYQIEYYPLKKSGGPCS